MSQQKVEELKETILILNNTIQQLREEITHNSQEKKVYIEKLQLTLEDSNVNNLKLASSLEEIKLKYAECSTDLKTSTSNSVSLMVQLESLQKQCSDKDSSYHELSSTHEKLKKKYQKLTNELHDLSLQHDSMRRKYTILESEVRELSQNVSYLQHLITEKDGKIEYLDKYIKENEIAIEEYETSLNGKNADLLEKESEISKFMEEILLFKGQLESLTIENKILENTKFDLQTDLKEALASSETKSIEILKLGKALEQKSSELLLSQQDVEKHKSMCKTLEESFHSARLIMEDLRSELSYTKGDLVNVQNSLQEQVKHLSATNFELQNEVKSNHTELHSQKEKYESLHVSLNSKHDKVVLKNVELNKLNESLKASNDTYVKHQTDLQSQVHQQQQIIANMKQEKENIEVSERSDDMSITLQYHKCI